MRTEELDFLAPSGLHRPARPAKLLLPAVPHRERLPGAQVLSIRLPAGSSGATGASNLLVRARPEPEAQHDTRHETRALDYVLGLGDPAALAPQPGAVDAGWVEAMARTVGVVRDLLSVAVPAVMLALVVHLFLAQATVVFGQSMEPNLSPFQRLIVDKLSYRLHTPQRNDIVVVDLPQLDDMLVKRVVGLPGETIAVRQGLVYVNGAPLLEPFAHDVDGATMAAVTVAADEYFVLGDNRDDSNDSRYFGPVPAQRIVGRVWLRYWPLHRLKLF